MKNYFYAVLIFIIIGLIYLKLSAPNNVPESSPSASSLVESSPTPSPVATTPLITEYFSLEYPTSATAPAVLNHPDSIEWRVMYMGDTQKASGRTQTELFDGYLLSIQRFETASPSSSLTQAEADRKGIIDACGEGNATTIEKGKLGQYDALTYYGGCLGEATHYYYDSGSALYKVAAMVVGPEASLPSYNSAIQSVFASLKILD